MSEKTIALSGAEVKVTFSGGNAWLRNDGAAVVYASKTAGITAGADGVVSIPAGGSAPVYGANGTVFLLGAGEVLLIGSDYATNPFKTSVTCGVITDMIASAVSNTNLLINPDFRINQRGKSSYDTGGYTVDMWTLLNGSGGNGIVTVTDNGLICSKQSGATGNSYFVQTIENSYIGEQVTLTICIDGSEHSVTATIPETGESASLQLENGRWYMTVVRGHLQVCCRLTENSNIINYVKLEIGGMATRFCVPDTATELAKCQRYYQIRSTGDINPVDLRPGMATINDIRQREDGNYEYIAEL